MVSLIHHKTLYKTSYTITGYNRTHLILFHLNLILWLGLGPRNNFTKIFPEDFSEVWTIETVDDEVCGGIENHEVSECVVSHPPSGRYVVPGLY